jgi:hypothetical protein
VLPPLICAVGPVTANPAGKLAAIGREAVSLRRRVCGLAGAGSGSGSVDFEVTVSAGAGGGAGTTAGVVEPSVGLLRFLAG